LRIYSVTDTGGVGPLLVREVISAVAKKGIRKTYVDLEAFKIRFPEEGVFVAIEHLGLAQNEYLMDDYPESY